MHRSTHNRHSNAHLNDGYVRKLAEPVKAGQYVMISVSVTGASESDRKSLGTETILVVEDDQALRLYTARY